MALQRQILSVVCEYVKPGGTLIYSTCTIHTAENEGNARWFEQTHPEFASIRCVRCSRKNISGTDFL